MFTCKSLAARDRYSTAVQYRAIPCKYCQHRVVTTAVLHVAVFKCMRGVPFVCESTVFGFMYQRFLFVYTRKICGFCTKGYPFGRGPGWGWGCNGIRNQFSRFQINIKVCLFATLFVFHVQFIRNHLKHNGCYMYRLLEH
jgi:hypothetical protein